MVWLGIMKSWHMCFLGNWFKLRFTNSQKFQIFHNQSLINTRGHFKIWFYVAKDQSTSSSNNMERGLKSLSHKDDLKLTITMILKCSELDQTENRTKMLQMKFLSDMVTEWKVATSIGPARATICRENSEIFHNGITRWSPKLSVVLTRVNRVGK